MPIAVFALSLAAFCIGTTEFIISGILLQVSRDLGTDIPTAGLLVTGYAAGVAIGGPILGLMLTRMPLKPAILGTIAIFAAGQFLCAIAPTYEMLLLARLVSACGHGVFFGVASVAVSQIAPPERRGAALSLLVGGITVANILGLPGGTAIGNLYGWRVAFVLIGIMALIAVVAIALTLKPPRREAEADAPLRVQAAQLRHQTVFLTYLTIAIIMVGQVAFGTFQVALLTEVTHIEPLTQVPLYLLVGGAGAVAGIWTGGRLADWKIEPSIIGILLGQIVVFAVMLPLVGNGAAMLVLLFVSSFVGFGFSTPVQIRILNSAKAAPRLAATMVSTAYNVGIAAGAFLGASLLRAGMGYGQLPITGIVSSAVALLVLLFSIQLSRRGVA